VKPGRTLFIYKPTASGEPQTEVASRRRTTQSGKKATVASKAAVDEDEKPAPEVSSKSNSVSHLKPVSKKTTRHKVKPGETLISIANSYNTTVAQLKKDNRLTASNLKAGQVLVIK
jgi:LysM repeat protein